MSATNRGAIRSPKDLYRTPRHTIQAIVKEISWERVSRALEPCQGDGRIIEECMKVAPHVHWSGYDISEGTDYLETEIPHCFFDLILTNPPFSLAQEFITKARKDAFCVIMLQRLNFLGSQKRNGWWQLHPVNVLFPLSRRPDFTGEGGDATDYSWFTWDPNAVVFPVKRRGIHVLEG